MFIVICHVVQCTQQCPPIHSSPLSIFFCLSMGVTCLWCTSLHSPNIIQVDEFSEGSMVCDFKGRFRECEELGVLELFSKVCQLPVSQLWPSLRCYQHHLCYKHRLHRHLTKIKLGLMPSNSATAAFKHIPQSVIDLLISKFSFFLLGILSIVNISRRSGGGQSW